MTSSGRQFVAGEWVSAEGDPLIATTPNGDQVLWSGPSAGQVTVNAAVTAARAASPAWSGLGHEGRRDYLEAFVSLLETQGEDLAQAISADVGKPLWEARTEVGSVKSKLAPTLAGYEERAATRVQPAGVAESVSYFRPLGVVAVLGPFNFPAHMPNGHIMPALLAGNTVVFKPSPLTPTSGEVYARLWESAGLPSGVFNLLQGGAETGQLLSSHEGVNGVFFNGSRRTGVAISEANAAHPEKLLVLEMGGNNALVVWDYDDVRAAIALTIQSCFITAGQRCTAARRLFIPEQDDGFLMRLAEAVSALAVEAPDSDPPPFLGPVINKESAHRLLEQQQALLDRGGVALVRMEPTERGVPFLRPGLIDVTDAPGLPDEEIFGPLLQVERVSSFEDAIAAVNRSRYGLSAGIVTRDKALFERFVQGTHAGVVNWNQQLTGASGLAPFGGVGCSGNHRPSGYMAVDYCSDAVARLEAASVPSPDPLPPGVTL